MPPTTANLVRSLSRLFQGLSRSLIADALAQYLRQVRGGRSGLLAQVLLRSPLFRRKLRQQHYREAAQATRAREQHVLLCFVRSGAPQGKYRHLVALFEGVPAIDNVPIPNPLPSRNRFEALWKAAALRHASLTTQTVGSIASAEVDPAQWLVRAPSSVHLHTTPPLAGHCGPPPLLVDAPAWPPSHAYPATSRGRVPLCWGEPVPIHWHGSQPRLVDPQPSGNLAARSGQLQ